MPTQIGAATASRLILTLTSALLLGLALLLSLFLWREHQLIDQGSREKARQLAELLDTHTSLAFQQIDTVLRSSVEHFEQAYIDNKLTTPQTREHLVVAAKSLDQVRVMVFINENGGLLYSSLQENISAVVLKHRSYFQVHEQQTHYGLYLSPPTKSVFNDDWFVALTRRVNKPDGSFGGIVGALVFSDYFNQYHKLLNLGPEDSISVFHVNGTGFARYPYSDKVVGKSFAEGKLFKEILPKASSGVSRPPTKTDGVSRLVAHRQLDSLPFVVTLGIGDAEAFDRWHQLVLMLILVYLSFSGMVLLLARNLLRQTRALEESRRALKREKEFEKGVFESSGSITFILHQDGRIHRVNSAAEAVTGRRREALIDKPFWSLLDATHAPRFRDAISRGEPQALGQFEEVELQGVKDQVHTLSMQITPLYNERGHKEYLIASGIDISDRKRTEALVWHQANHDALTGLPNRSLFLDRLGQEVIRHQRTGRPLALLFIDIDHFKQINDAYGHGIGDRVLIDFAERLEGSIRQQDTAARYAGDEFTVLLPELDSAQDAHHVCQRILDAMLPPTAIEGPELIIGASIGVAFYPNGARDVDELVMHADRAMYQAKSGGRNRYALYTPDLNTPAPEPRRSPSEG